MVEAAALPETVLTVWANVFQTGGAEAERDAARSWRRFGHRHHRDPDGEDPRRRVIATAGDAAKVKLCEKLGAERCINYRTEDFEMIVRDLGGADVVLDMVGGPYIQKNLDVLNADGRCVMIAFLQGPARRSSI